MIFDEAALRKLQQLMLVSGRVRAGAFKGERRSTKRGSSVEFADYRDYAPGDDLRRLDWNIYARLERPFIKLLEEEEDLAVHLLVDASRSMDWGEELTNKFRFALQLAGALGAIALGAGDRLTATLLQSGQVAQTFGPTSGQAALMRLLMFLEAAHSGGETDLNESLKDYTLAPRRPGLAFLLTDLFSPAGFEDGLARLQGRGYEVNLLHLLAPDEIDPPLAGDLRLVDVETGQSQEVSLDGGLRQDYRRRVQAWQGEIQQYCQKRQIRYIPVSSATPWDRLVLSELRRAGVVK